MNTCDEWPCADPPCAGAGRRWAVSIIDVQANLEPGQRRVGHRAAHHAPREHDQDADDGADDQDAPGRKMMGENTVCGCIGRVRTLARWPPKMNTCPPIMALLVRVRLPPEDQNVAAHRPIEKNVPGENRTLPVTCHSSRRSTENSWHSEPSRLARHHNIPAKVAHSLSPEIRVQTIKHRENMPAFPQGKITNSIIKTMHRRSGKTVSGAIRGGSSTLM